MSISSECLTNPPALSSSSGLGNVQLIAGLSSYVTGLPDSKRAIILVSDVFGYEAPKLRKLADKIATVGKFLVVVPDFFNDEPLNLSNPKVNTATWLRAHNVEKGSENAKSVITELKSKGVLAVGAAGFCWGGSVVIKLASDSTKIEAAAVLHPGPINYEEINEIKVPIAILGGECDKISPPERLIRAGEILSAKSEFESYVKIFPGMGHGWSVRYNDEDEFAVKSAEEAHLDVLNWFTKYVK